MEQLSPRSEGRARTVLAVGRCTRQCVLACYPWIANPEAAEPSMRRARSSHCQLHRAQYAGHCTCGCVWSLRVHQRNRQYNKIDHAIGTRWSFCIPSTKTGESHRVKCQGATSTDHQAYHVEERRWFSSRWLRSHPFNLWNLLFFLFPNIKLFLFRQIVSQIPTGRFQRIWKVNFTAWNEE